MNQSRHHQAEVIAKRTMQTVSRPKLAQEIAAYLLETKQTAQLESLLRDVMAYRADNGVVEATVVSAHPLNNDIKDRIKTILKSQYPHAKTMLLDEEIDPSMIGGLKIVMPGEQLDATLATKLNTFKRLTAQEMN